jgi:hypothetical protein
VRHKHLRECGLVPEDPLNLCFPHAHSYASAQRACSCQTFCLADQASFADKLIDSEDRDHRFLALLGNDSDLYFALSNIKDRVRDISLRKDNALLPMR